MARILVVDDDAIVLDLVKDILEKYQEQEYHSEFELKVTGVRSAIEALELLKDNQYELIITDILMAKMDGWEFIREIRKKYPQFNVPIVVISAVQGVDLEYESMRHGASGWFYKPIRPKEFAREVFRLIQER
jgi:CheY-like chemotaxis protein